MTHDSHHADYDLSSIQNLGNPFYWGSWGSWGTCSNSCGSGVATRFVSHTRNKFTRRRAWHETFDTDSIFVVVFEVISPQKADIEVRFASNLFFVMLFVVLDQFLVTAAAIPVALRPRLDHVLQVRR